MQKNTIDAAIFSKEKPLKFNLEQTLKEVYSNSGERWLLSYRFLRTIIKYIIKNVFLIDLQKNKIIFKGVK